MERKFLAAIFLTLFGALILASAFTMPESIKQAHLIVWGIMVSGGTVFLCLGFFLMGRKSTR